MAPEVLEQGEGVFGLMCNQCHSLEEGEEIAGPSLYNIGARAGDTVEGLGAREYIRQSIIDPKAYIAEENQDYPHQMQEDYELILTSEMLDAVVAYLLTLD